VWENRQEDPDYTLKSESTFLSRAPRHPKEHCFYSKGSHTSPACPDDSSAGMKMIMWSGTDRGKQVSKYEIKMNYIYINHFVPLCKTLSVSVTKSNQLIICRITQLLYQPMHIYKIYTLKH